MAKRVSEPISSTTKIDSDTTCRWILKEIKQTIKNYFSLQVIPYNQYNVKKKDKGKKQREVIGKPNYSVHHMEKIGISVENYKRRESKTHDI